VLIEKEYLTSGDKNVFAMSVEEMKTDMRNNKVDLANLTIDDLGIWRLL
jgi:DNA helicase-2/ATP-dependent DNA helicase PcrA